MPRRLRFIPTRHLVSVTCRTLRSEFRLRPDPRVNSIVAGALGRALELHGVELHAVTAMSSHLHLLLTPDNAKELARFMHMLNRKVAFELNRLQGCTGALWDGRYHAILVSHEESAQVAQLKYVLAQGCKEGLVASPVEWPGVQSARHLLRDETIEGHWFHRTAFRKAKQRGEDVTTDDFTTRHQIRLTPLPVWQHLDIKTYRRRIEEIVRTIEEETATMHRRQGTKPLGVTGVVAVDSFDKARKPECSPQPLVHAASKAKRDELRTAYREFYGAFRKASDRLKDGEATMGFPPGSFPPSLPYIEDL